MPRLPVYLPMALALAGCGGDRIEEVTVIGTDYAFEVPAAVASGLTSLSFENRGAVPHELILARLREGFDIDDVLEAGKQGRDPREFIEGGASILIAGPGESSDGRVLLDLLPGRTYALLCNFVDAEGAPPHTALGMHAALSVD